MNIFILAAEVAEVAEQAVEQGGNSMLTVYWTCLLLGFIWLVIQVLLADFGSDFGDFDVDPGAIDVTVDGVDLDPADVLGAGEVTLSPVSPMVISGFITIFGMAGIIATSYISFPEKSAGILTALIALGVGILGAAVIWWILSAIIKAVCGSSEAKVAQLIGHEAEVITPIRGSGVGEIAYIFNGSRYNSPARTLDKTDVERNTLVKIVRIVGTTYFVKELTEEEIANPPKPPESIE